MWLGPLHGRSPNISCSGPVDLGPFIELRTVARVELARVREFCT
jgi:hypothetical protein